MTSRTRLLSLTLAVAINCAALAGLHHAMADGAERARSPRARSSAWW